VRKSKVDASAFLLAAIVLLLGTGVFFTINTVISDPVGEALAGSRALNALFIIEHDKKPLGCYVLFYYPLTKRATIVDVPGEVGMIIQSIDRVDRIDTVYDPRRPGAFQGEVEALLGADLDFSIVFDTQNLGRLVDLLEGVELFIPTPVEVYDLERPVLFPSGVQRLDGDKAQLYFTYQLPDEDEDMVHFRRQRFLLSLLKRMGERNGILKNGAVARVYRSLFNAGVNSRIRMRYFDELAALDVDRISVRSVAGNFREVSGQLLLFPYDDGRVIRDIVSQVLHNLTLQSEGNVTERRFTVEVLNGTTSNGLAGRTAELLRGFGYDVIAIGNADRNDYETTEIIDRSGYADVVQSFADIIQCKNIRHEAALFGEGALNIDITPQYLEYKSDFTLIIGKDFNGRNVSG
jgi:anionic cell wall polymer biosynthesis LytR-Cps2A-Psr (LCP) family protein